MKTLAKLEYAEKRVQQKWYDLVMAEQQGASEKVLERMYHSYILALEEYNRCSSEYQRECQGDSDPGPIRQKKSA